MVESAQPKPPYIIETISFDDVKKAVNTKRWILTTRRDIVNEAIQTEQLKEYINATYDKPFFYPGRLIIVNRKIDKLVVAGTALIGAIQQTNPFVHGTVAVFTYDEMTEPDTTILTFTVNDDVPITAITASKKMAAEFALFKRRVVKDYAAFMSTEYSPPYPKFNFEHMMDSFITEKTYAEMQKAGLGDADEMINRIQKWNSVFEKMVAGMDLYDFQKKCSQTATEESMRSTIATIKSAQKPFWLCLVKNWIRWIMKPPPQLAGM
jgi:hypothetical protein